MAQDGPRLAQDGPRMAQGWPKVGPGREKARRSAGTGCAAAKTHPRPGRPGRPELGGGGLLGWGLVLVHSTEYSVQRAHGLHI
ncbi:hypothetical protein I7I48_08328 [Histoplasma ohiense]|nr:hypothetical protein I7I48_08328 [Histoplasma ohiense (nom. inval.)]